MPAFAPVERPFDEVFPPAAAVDDADTLAPVAAFFVALEWLRWVALTVEELEVCGTILFERVLVVANCNAASFRGADAGVKILSWFDAQATLMYQSTPMKFFVMLMVLPLETTVVGVVTAVRQPYMDE